MSSWNTMLIRQRRYDSLYWKNTKTVLVTSTREARTLVGVLHLTAQILAGNGSSCQTVLDAGLLNMLLRIYVIFPSFSHSTLDDADGWSALLDACRSILLAVSQAEQSYDEISSHAIHSLWTDCQPLPPAYTVQPPSLDDVLSARCAAWRQANSQCVKRRIVTIYLGCLWKVNPHKYEDVEACVDMVEFTK